MLQTSDEPLEFSLQKTERTLLRQAHVAFDKNDLRWAALAAQRAWSFDPNSTDACRVLADIAQK